MNILNVNLLAVLTSGYVPKELKTNVYSFMFMTLLTRAGRKMEAAQVPIPSEQINRTWYIHSIEHDSASKGRRDSDTDCNMDKPDG